MIAFPDAHRLARAAAAAATLIAAGITGALAQDTDLSTAANEWRAARRIIDLHVHLGESDEAVERALRVMDAAGIGAAVNLSGGYVTPDDSGTSPFERTRDRCERIAPGRFVHYMNLNYAGWNEPDFSDRAAQQIADGRRLGAAGLKEYKRLGLFLRGADEELIAVDDPKLDAVWRRCGELGMPVSIHVADPKAFWLPYDASNERWTELKDHPSWWFGDRAKFPPRMELLEALNRVIERHPATTFVAVHFANNAEDLNWVDRALSRYPNMRADIAARIPEIGRHDPVAVRGVFTKHQNRILFATDFMVYDRFILGSGGDGPPPTEDDAIEFYRKHWQWFETSTRQMEHMTPIQGDWRIDAIDLPDDVLRKIYFDNARELLAGSLPLPRIAAAKVGEDAVVIDGKLDETAWLDATPAFVESRIDSGEIVPPSGSEARLLWNDDALIISFRSPFQSLRVFEDGPLPDGAEREGLWDRDVVEVFVAPGDETPELYYEFEVAPTSEQLDLEIGGGGLAWNSGFLAAAAIDEKAGIWIAEMRIPMKAVSPESAPAAGTTFRLNLYRHDSGAKHFLGWNPTLARTAHRPERFGILTLKE